LDTSYNFRADVQAIIKYHSIHDKISELTVEEKMLENKVMNTQNICYKYTICNSICNMIAGKYTI